MYGFEARFAQPYLTKEVQDKIIEGFDKIKPDLSRRERINRDMKQHDEIINSILKHFDDDDPNIIDVEYKEISSEEV